MVVLSQRIDDLTKGKNEKGKVDRGKSDKEDEPSVGKGDARSVQWVEITMKKDYLKRFVWYLDSGCSRHMTRIKQYLHIYSKEPGPKVVFGDNSSGDTEGYGSVNCNGITFMRVAYVIGLKHNLISISQLCDANYKVLFIKTQGTFKTKRSFSISKSLHLLHIDLFRPVKPQTIIHNKYTLVIVDEYSRNTWVFCLKKKSDAADCIMYFIRQMENINDTNVKQLRSDNAERRNRTSIEVVRTMLNGVKLPKQFWGEAVNAACYTQNRSIIMKRHKKTTYEVFRGRAPDVSYFHVFGYPVNIHNHRDHLGKFDAKADDGFFLDDEAISQTITEGDDVNINEVSSFPEDEFIEPRNIDTLCTANTEYFPYVLAFDLLSSNIKEATIMNEADHPKLADNHSLDEQLEEIRDRWSREKHIELVNIISKPLAGITNRSRVRDLEATSAHECQHVNFLSQIEPKRLVEALVEEGWVLAMTEENKMDEDGIVTKNKARLVAKLYSQEEGIYYDETFAPVARLEAIRIFLAYASYMRFTVYQIDVKSAFQNGKITEEVYVEQPPGFESSEFPNHVSRLTHFS
ncbi:retrovirus-related pol polyprotein from transposon TNT 1-94 [Tanacetum coccineum]